MKKISAAFLHTPSAPVLIALLTAISIFLHFYNLNWGAPFYFHPDERNIASSISQLVFPHQLNPKFFAYGSLPIYTIFFVGIISNFFGVCQSVLDGCYVRFEEAIIISRMFSASFATLLIPLVYSMGKLIHDKTTGLIAAFLTTFSTGIIQFSHFGTFELWTTFFATLQLLLSFLFIKKGTKLFFYILVLCTGIVISVKVSNLVLISVPIAAVILRIFFHSHAITSLKQIKNWVKLVFSIIFLLAYTACFFLVTNPFSFLSFESFKGSLTYESTVALGTLPVFYTGEFYNSVPFIFQFLKVYPFLLNPFILLTFLISFLFVFYKVLKEKNRVMFLLLLSFSALYFSQAALYVKWVRYMLPTLPFIYLFIGYSGATLLKNGRLRIVRKLSFVLLGTSSIVFSLSYFITAFVETDTRLLARDFARKTIPVSAPIVSEVYDLGITPFNDYFSTITLLNFYDIDTQGDYLSSEINEQLKNARYLILPSQRILATRMLHPEKFPKGHAFYSKLDTLNRYTKIYETPCSIFCQITYLGNPIDRFEGTANVFDRPHLMIYKINNQ